MMMHSQSHGTVPEELYIHLQDLHLYAFHHHLRKFTHPLRYNMVLFHQHDDASQHWNSVLKQPLHITFHVHINLSLEQSHAPLHDLSTAKFLFLNDICFSYHFKNAPSKIIIVIFTTTLQACIEIIMLLPVWLLTSII